MPLDLDLNALPKLSGDVLAFTFQDPDIDPNAVLDIDHDWKIRVEWHVLGAGANNLAGADWHIKVNIESMGPQEEKTLENVIVPGTAYLPISTANHVHYAKEITVQARDKTQPLPDRVNEEGVYRLVVILTHDKVGGFPGPDRVAGFREGPMLQFYAFQ
jgi:hypothetical protein